MNNNLLVITITTYIISIALCLILSIALRKVEISKFKLPFLIHTSLILIFCVVYMINANSPSLHYLLLAFVCSGLMLSGIVLRSAFHRPVKIYFSLFLITILFFLASPSLLLRSISYSWNANNVFQQFHIRNNYFLQEQQSMLHLESDQVKYKVVQSFGVFHKTIARDITFRNRISDIKVISFEPSKSITLRGYFTTKSSSVENRDSVDVSAIIKLKTEKITRKSSTLK